jgi:hypothetical protein
MNTPNTRLADVPDADRTASVEPRSPWRGALWMVLAVLAFYLLREHWNHLTGNAVYLLLLVCPLMHVFGHRHGRGHGQGPHTHGRREG